MQVSELMSTNIVAVSPDSTAAEAAKTMTRSDVGIVLVCGQNGSLQGVLTDRDIVTRCVAVQSDPVQTKVQDLMTRNVVTISPNEEMKTAADLLSGEQIRRIPVVEGTRVVGMLSLADLVHSDLYDMEAAQALTEITSPTREY